MQIPEVRLIAAGDDTNPVYYAVIKGPNGWYGAPGLRKGQFLTDADVADAVPLQPGPSAVVEVRKVGDYFDVDVNGKAGARRVASFIAGEFAVQTALQAGGPVMLTAKQVAGVVELKKGQQPRFELVTDTGDSPVNGG